MLAQLADLRQGRAQALEQSLRARHEVLDRLLLHRDRGVLHRQQVPQGELEALLDDVGLDFFRAVQRGQDQPVAGVEVRGPVGGVVLVGPRHVPDRRARQRHRREPVSARAQGVLGVVVLDEQRQRQAGALDDLAREQAHPPAVVGGVDALVQLGRLTQRLLGEVVVGDRAGRRPPDALAEVNDLAHGVQPRAGLQVEHLAADDHRLRGGTGERVRPQHAVRLQRDVVVDDHDLVGVRVVDALVHHAGEAAGTTEVFLLDDLELVADPPGGLGEAVGFADLLRSLVGHHDPLHDVHHLRVLAQRLEREHAVGGPDRSGADQHLLLGQRHVGGPGRLVDLQRDVVGEQVEPDPAAVLERRQRHPELQRRPVRAGHRGALQVDAVSVGLRTVDVEPTGPLDLQPQHDLVDLGPTLPVAGREGVEVGGEGDLVVRGHQQAAPRHDGRGAVQRRGLVDVQRAHVQRILATREHDPLQHLLGRHVGGPGAHRRHVAELAFTRGGGTVLSGGPVGHVSPPASRPANDPR